jgi:hypothetical protein
LFKNNNFLVSSVGNILDFFFEFVYLKIIFGLLVPQKFGEAFFLVLGNGIFESDSGYKSVMAGIGAPSIDMKFLIE